MGFSDLLKTLDTSELHPTVKKPDKERAEQKTSEGKSFRDFYRENVSQEEESRLDEICALPEVRNGYELFKSAISSLASVDGVAIGNFMKTTLEEILNQKEIPEETKPQKEVESSIPRKSSESNRRRGRRPKRFSFEEEEAVVNNIAKDTTNFSLTTDQSRETTPGSSNPNRRRSRRKVRRFSYEEDGSVTNPISQVTTDFSFTMDLSRESTPVSERRRGRRKVRALTYEEDGTVINQTPEIVKKATPDYTFSTDQSREATPEPEASTSAVVNKTQEQQLFKTPNSSRKRKRILKQDLVYEDLSFVSKNYSDDMRPIFNHLIKRFPKSVKHFDMSLYLSAGTLRSMPPVSEAARRAFETEDRNSVEAPVSETKTSQAVLEVNQPVPTISNEPSTSKSENHMEELSTVPSVPAHRPKSRQDPAPVQLPEKDDCPPAVPAPDYPKPFSVLIPLGGLRKSVKKDRDVANSSTVAQNDLLHTIMLDHPYSLPAGRKPEPEVISLLSDEDE